MKKYHILILVLVFSIAFVISETASNDFLSKGRADSLYCQLTNGCPFFKQSNPQYGELWNHTDAMFTLSLPVLDMYQNITQLINGTFLGVNQSGGRIIINLSGIYSVGYTLSLSGSANQEVHLDVGVNGKDTEKCHAHRTIGTGGDIGNAGATCLLNLSKGDIITLMAKDSNNPVQDIDIIAGNINLHLINDSQFTRIRDIIIQQGGGGGVGNFTGVDNTFIFNDTSIITFNQSHWNKSRAIIEDLNISNSLIVEENTTLNRVNITGEIFTNYSVRQLCASVSVGPAVASVLIDGLEGNKMRNLGIDIQTYSGAISATTVTGLRINSKTAESYTEFIVILPFAGTPTIFFSVAKQDQWTITQTSGINRTSRAMIDLYAPNTTVTDGHHVPRVGFIDILTEGRINGTMGDFDIGTLMFNGTEEVTSLFFFPNSGTFQNTTIDLYCNL